MRKTTRCATLLTTVHFLKNAMLLLISPAKTLDFETPVPTKKVSSPVLLSDASALARVMKTQSEDDLTRLMKISPKLAELNRQRFQTWTPKSGVQRQAIFAFKGDVYLGMDAESFSATDLNFAQKHLRILSGLYGVLKPLDTIKPYRLEMGTRLKNPKGNDLYAFWRKKLSNHLMGELKKNSRPTIINLASNEYFGAVDPELLPGVTIINPIFKESRDGRMKIISFFAKRARGAMANHIVKARIKQPEALKQFNIDGYSFRPDLSQGSDWVFAR